MIDWLRILDELRQRQQTTYDRAPQAARLNLGLAQVFLNGELIGVQVVFSVAPRQADVICQPVITAEQADDLERWYQR